MAAPKGTAASSEPGSPRRAFLWRTAAIAAVGSFSTEASGMQSKSPENDSEYEGLTPPDSEEQRLTDLVTANHILADQGVNDAFGHVSVRSLANPQHYYISRSRAPELVSRNDLMEFDLDCRPIDPRGRKTYEERYIHGEIYRARPDVMCVIHSHTPAVIPFGVTDVPLRPLIHMAAFLPQQVPVFEIRDVEGDDNHILVTNPRSGMALAKVIGAGTAALMRGHGCTVVGIDIRQAVYRAVYLKLAAEIQLMAHSLSPQMKSLGEKEAANFNMRLNYMGTQQPLRPWPVWEARSRAHRAELFKPKGK